MICWKIFKINNASIDRVKYGYVYVAVCVAIISVGIFTVYYFNQNYFSITAEDTTKPIPQHNIAFIDPSLCSSRKDISNSTAILIECILTSSNATGIGNLPSAIFMEKNIIGHPYGSHLVYIPQFPENLLSQDQIDKVIDVIRNDPQIKSQHFAWKVSSLELYPYKYSWHTDVHLVIHGIGQHLGDCSWGATMTIDLNDLTITKRENTDVTSYERC